MKLLGIDTGGSSLKAAPVDVTTGGLHERDHVGRVVRRRFRRDEFARLRCREAEVFEVGEPFRALGQRGVLSGLRIGGLDLVQCDAEFLGLRLKLFRLPLRLGQ